MVEIYTRKGDGGRTGIWGGRRLGKDHARVEAIGAVDECSAAIGAAAAARPPDRTPDRTAEVLADVQDRLFVVGCELMAPDRDGPGASVPRLSGADVARLETAIDEADARLPEPTAFIHPAGTPRAAGLHLARAVCRRAERRVTALRRTEPVGDHVAAYLNRLADLLLVLARDADATAGTADRTRTPRH